MNLAVLRVLAKRTGSTSAKALRDQLDIGTRHQRQTALVRLRGMKLVTLSGTTNDRRYTLTASGRRAAKEGAIQERRSPIPMRVAKPEIKAGLLAILQQLPEWCSMPELLALHPPGTGGGIKQAMLALRQEGSVIMRGTKGRARYNLAHRKKAAAPVSAKRATKNARPSTKKAGRLNGMRVKTRPLAVGATQASAPPAASPPPSHPPAGTEET
jgi:hypothetical protein